MKLVLMTTAVAMVATLFVQDAGAGEPQTAEVPSAVLAGLGLGGMQTLSSSEGMKVRGKELGNLGASGVELVSVVIKPEGEFPALLLPTRTTLVPMAALGGLGRAALVPPIIKK